MRNLRNFWLLLICCLAATHATHAQKKPTKPTPTQKTATTITPKTDAPLMLSPTNINEIINNLTPEEKARLMMGTGMFFDFKTGQQTVGEYQNRVQGAAGSTYPVPRLGIPSIYVVDGPAGVRIFPKRTDDPTNTYFCTAFPIATLLASSWDTKLVEAVGAAMGNEVLEYGADVLLGPGMNIHRNPLGGRNYEYYSEDPLLTGRIAAAMVRGVQSQGVGTSIKHFAANNHETERNNINVIVTPRTLREIYLEGFRIAVQDAQPWTVMSSYNKINGVHTAERKDLLTDVLRNDWGFKGLVMTDWYGRDHAADQQIAGNELIMPGTEKQYNALLNGIKSGKIPADVVNRNLTNLMQLILKSPTYKNYKFTNKPNLIAHAKIARQAAAEGIILLKNNDKTLPFNENIRTIAAFGNTSYNVYTGGTGSGDVNEAYSIDLEQGLTNAGLNLSQSLKKQYLTFITDAKTKQPTPRPFMPIVPLPDMALTMEQIAAEANTADLALITIGRSCGEFFDRNITDYDLNTTEKELINNVTKQFAAKGKKTVVILNIGNTIEVESWKNTPDAIVLSWQGGQETGNSIADVLTGKVNPSGKLATSFVMDYNAIPSSNGFPGTPPNKPTSITYSENLNIGYRDASVATAYEFGYGLSYTTFALTNAALTQNPNDIILTCNIQNTGSVAGKEVAQIYISLPQGNLPQPAKKLAAFAKTDMLNAGQSTDLKFSIKARDFAYFNEEKSAWMLDAGTYTIHVGTSVNDIAQSIEFIIANETMVERQNPGLLPATPSPADGDVQMPNF